MNPAPDNHHPNAPTINTEPRFKPQGVFDKSKTREPHIKPTRPCDETKNHRIATQRKCGEHFQLTARTAT